MLGRLIATIAVLGVAAFSLVRYQALNSTYDRTRQALQSDQSFVSIYKALILAALLIALGSYWFRGWWLLTIHDSPALRITGTIVSLLGVLGFEASVRALGSEYSPCFDLRLPTKRVQAGPYRYFAHPMYLSNVTILGGAFISSGSLWVLLVTAIVSGYYVRSAHTEAKAMIHRSQPWSRGPHGGRSSWPDR